MKLSSVKKRKARIEIIPLIDIVFFLLATFVMVSLAMVKNQGVTVNLPTAASSQSFDKTTPVLVSVTKMGTYYINKNEVSLEGLKTQLKALKESNPQLKVSINGDKEADFGTAVEVLDIARRLGIAKVSIQTKK